MSKCSSCSLVPALRMHVYINRYGVVVQERFREMPYLKETIYPIKEHSNDKTVGRPLPFSTLSFLLIANHAGGSVSPRRKERL